MSKREEIRETLRHFIAEAMFGEHGEDDIEPLVVQAYLKLHSQGVVIKVDRKIIEGRGFAECGFTNEPDGEPWVRYVAVEPLIEHHQDPPKTGDTLYGMPIEVEDD